MEQMDDIIIKYERPSRDHKKFYRCKLICNYIHSVMMLHNICTHSKFNKYKVKYIKFEYNLLHLITR